MNILNELKKHSDQKQKEFLAKLVPTVNIKNILGVKNPICRSIAKEAYKNDEKSCIQFINKLPHKYLEEYILHGAILEQIKDYDDVLKYTEKVILYFDNWATTDTYSPKIVKKHLKDFYKHIVKWIKSKKTYVIRFGIEMFMSFYLDENNLEKNGLDKNIICETSKIISSIRYKSKFKYKKENQTECPDKYYVDMMVAWYFATLLAKDYKTGLYFIKNSSLETWTHNMSIKKAIESYRVSDEHKKELRNLLKKI